MDRMIKPKNTFELGSDSEFLDFPEASLGKVLVLGRLGRTNLQLFHFWRIADEREKLLEELIRTFKTCEQVQLEKLLEELIRTFKTCEQVQLEKFQNFFGILKNSVTNWVDWLEDQLGPSVLVLNSKGCHAEASNLEKTIFTLATCVKISQNQIYLARSSSQQDNNERFWTFLRSASNSAEKDYLPWLLSLRGGNENQEPGRSISQTLRVFFEPSVEEVESSTFEKLVRKALLPSFIVYGKTIFLDTQQHAEGEGCQVQAAKGKGEFVPVTVEVTYPVTDKKPTSCVALKLVSADASTEEKKEIACRAAFLADRIPTGMGVCTIVEDKDNFKLHLGYEDCREWKVENGVKSLRDVFYSLELLKRVRSYLNQCRTSKDSQNILKYVTARGKLGIQLSSSVTSLTAEEVVVAFWLDGFDLSERSSLRYRRSSEAPWVAVTELAVRFDLEPCLEFLLESGVNDARGVNQGWVNSLARRLSDAEKYEQSRLLYECPDILDKDDIAKICTDIESTHGETVSSQVRMFLYSYTNEMWPQYGRRGLIFHGPAGTGKSMLCKFIKEKLLPRSGNLLIHCTAADLNSRYIGETEAKIRDLVLPASMARNELFLVILEEVDTIAADPDKKASGGQDYKRDVLTVLLDAISENPNVIFFGTTNHRNKIDERVLRSKRLGMHVLVGSPPAGKRVRYLSKTLWGTFACAVKGTDKDKEEYFKRMMVHLQEMTRSFTFSQLEDIVTNVESFKGDSTNLSLGKVFGGSDTEPTTMLLKGIYLAARTSSHTRTIMDNFLLYIINSLLNGSKERVTVSHEKLVRDAVESSRLLLLSDETWTAANEEKEDAENRIKEAEEKTEQANKKEKEDAENQIKEAEEKTEQANKKEKEDAENRIKEAEEKIRTAAKKKKEDAENRIKEAKEKIKEANKTLEEQRETLASHNAEVERAKAAANDAAFEFNEYTKKNQWLKKMRICKENSTSLASEESKKANENATDAQKHLGPEVDAKDVYMNHQSIWTLSQAIAAGAIVPASLVTGKVAAASGIGVAVSGAAGATASQAVLATTGAAMVGMLAVGFWAVNAEDNHFTAIQQASREAEKQMTQKRERDLCAFYADMTKKFAASHKLWEAIEKQFDDVLADASEGGKEELEKVKCKVQEAKEKLKNAKDAATKCQEKVMDAETKLSLAQLEVEHASNCLEQVEKVLHFETLVDQARKIDSVFETSPALTAEMFRIICFSMREQLQYVTGRVRIFAVTGLAEIEFYRDGDETNLQKHKVVFHRNDPEFVAHFINAICLICSVDFLAWISDETREAHPRAEFAYYMRDILDQARQQTTSEANSMVVVEADRVAGIVPLSTTSTGQTSKGTTSSKSLTNSSSSSTTNSNNWSRGTTISRGTTMSDTVTDTSSMSESYSRTESKSTSQTLSTSVSVSFSLFTGPSAQTTLSQSRTSSTSVSINKGSSSTKSHSSSKTLGQTSNNAMQSSEGGGQQKTTGESRSTGTTEGTSTNESISSSVTHQVQFPAEFSAVLEACASVNRRFRSNDPFFVLLYRFTEPTVVVNAIAEEIAKEEKSEES